MTKHHCDRCKSTITGNRSVLTATRGELAVEVLEDTPLTDGLDLCHSCAAAFLDWLRGGTPNLTHQSAPGGAMSPMVGGLAVTR